ncbi:hypothetical protein CRG98_003190 [Punica granatum]|uniref:Uncharacterized protein n=1 Tax=Punica granatum TaxID=22663 RepID=A0A2I0L6Q3_PUNGR|nr:hypothetical protein CRG98_003190 [Punica granatum]
MARCYSLFKAFVIVSFLFFLMTIPSSLGRADYGVHARNLPLVKTNARKVLEVNNALLDYDDVCPNPRHDPRRKPGCNKYFNP